MTRTFEQITTERRERVLLITLDRPDRLNAWTPLMMTELFRAIGAANDDPSIGAVVITGAGRGFCAGADMDAVFSSPPTDAGEMASAKDWVAFCRSSKPLVAAINGPAIGVGLTMILPFDRLVAAEGAKVSMRFVRLGIVPELASTHFLVSRCGWGTASWLALSGDTITAEEAAGLGLVDRVCGADELLDQAIADATLLGSNPPLAVRLIKDLLTANAVETDLHAAQGRELRALAEASASADHREAVQAFLEKRPRETRG